MTKQLEEPDDPRRSPSTPVSGAVGAISGTLLLMAVSHLPMQFQEHAILWVPSVTVGIYWTWEWIVGQAKAVAEHRRKKEIEAKLKRRLELLDTDPNPDVIKLLELRKRLHAAKIADAEALLEELEEPIS